MATNKPAGDGQRKGAVKQRSQILNPQNDHFVKRDTSSGKFMDQSSKKNTPFKGVRKEK